LFPSLRETLPAPTRPVVWEFPEVMVKPPLAIAFHSTGGGGGGGGVPGLATSAGFGASGLAKVNEGFDCASAGPASSSERAANGSGRIFMAAGL
jgi:hypothetical protein